MAKGFLFATDIACGRLSSFQACSVLVDGRNSRVDAVVSMSFGTWSWRGDCSMKRHWQQDSRVFAINCDVYPRWRTSQLPPRSNGTIIGRGQWPKTGGREGPEQISWQALRGPNVASDMCDENVIGPDPALADDFAKIRS